MRTISNYFRQRDRGWVLSLLLLVCLVYLPFLGNPFVFDDRQFFTDDVLKQYRHVFSLDLRWFPYASLAWSAALFSDVVPHFFHLGNLLLHAVNVIVLFYFLRHLVTAVLPDERDSARILWGAWWGALIFALHPVAVYAVGYVVQRSILMATLFVLLMQLAYLRGLLTGRVRWLALSVLCYFLAVFSKEHSVLAPAVLAAFPLLLGKRRAPFRTALWLTWAAFLAVAILVTLRAQGVLGTPYEVMAAKMFEQQGVAASTPMLHLLSALMQAGLFFKYLLLWLVPNVAWMAVDMREPFVSTLADWRVWGGVLAFLAYGAAAIWLLSRGGMKGLLGFALLYPWLLFWVEFSGIRVQEPFVLYRSYLWMTGMMLLIPLLLLRLPPGRGMVLMGCVALLLIPLAWNRLWVFADDYRLWNEAAVLLKDEKMAGADRIFYNRGQALLNAHQWEAAAQDFERSVALRPDLAPIHLALADAYRNAGQNQQALEQYDAALLLKPDDASAYFGKGLVLKRLHRDAESWQQLQQSCRLNHIGGCLITSLPNQ